MSWVDKVTTGTKSSVSVVASVPSWFATAVESITQFAYQVKIRLISQLIEGISSVLQKLPTHFNDFIISIFLCRYGPFDPLFFSVNLNESVALPALKAITTQLLFTYGLSLQYYHKYSDISE